MSAQAAWSMGNIYPLKILTSSTETYLDGIMYNHNMSDGFLVADL
jgi:hypothetical protein